MLATLLHDRCLHVIFRDYQKEILLIYIVHLLDKKNNKILQNAQYKHKNNTLWYDTFIRWKGGETTSFLHIIMLCSEHKAVNKI